MAFSFGDIDETPGLAVDNPNLGRLISCPTIELRTRDAESGESLVFLARDYAADRTLRQLFQTVRLFQEGSDDLRTLIHMLVSNHRTRGGERSLRLIARSVLATLRLGDLPYAYRQ